MCIYLKGPGNTDVFKSDRFLSHRFAVRLNRMQVPCRAKITKILSLFEGIRKLSKWVEVHGKKRIPPTPTLSTSLPLGSVIIEEGRLKWWNGKVGISERGWEWWVEGSVCKRELVRESRLKKGESEQRARKCIIQRERGGEIIAGSWFLSHFALIDLSEGTWAFHVDTPFQCKNINVQQLLNVVCLWIVCAAYSCCRCNSNWECKQEASVEKLQCCAAATEHFSLIKTHLAVTGENVWQLMSLWF